MSWWGEKPSQTSSSRFGSRPMIVFRHSFKRQPTTMDAILPVVSNLLSTITIVSSLFLKVPQIMFIRQRQSAEGIYLQAMLMEIVSFTIVTLYNYTNKYSLMTYMEYPIILLQIYVMLYYVLKYKGLINLQMVPLTAILYVAVVVGFIKEFFSKAILAAILPLCTPMSGFAKVTYIYGIIRERNADSVSLTTWVISISTNLARLFTVFMDSADVKLMANFFISAMLSLGVLLTAMYYKKISVASVASLSEREDSIEKEKVKIHKEKEKKRHHVESHRGRHHHDD